MFDAMVGKGRHPILGVRSPDPILSTVAPIGLAAAAGTALVVDLVSTASDDGRTLADLVTDGPSISELSPGRTGVALLAGGRVDLEDAAELIARLGRHWPALVIRLPQSATELPFPSVPVVPLFPGRLSPVRLPPSGVWQPVGTGADPPGPGPVLPRLSAGLVNRILSGRLPRRSRWIESWRRVWELPWA
ncbi:MAG TPA: hypothetical protein VMM14_00495 [Acidimicrobiia bacterium]|nr:hypothetical protein [Acidimicrobiia bacterium]